MGAAALPRRLGLPAAPLPQPRRPRSGVGGGQRGRHPGRVPRRRHRRPDRPQLLPQRAADPARLPRRRGELPLRRLHGHPRTAGADPGDDDLRRRARALPRAAHRGHRAGRDLGAVVDAPDGVGVRRLRPPRGAPAGAVAAAERVRAPPDPLHAVPDRGRRVDHRAGRAGGLPVLVGLPARRGRPPPDRALRGVARRDRRSGPPGLLPRQLRRPHGGRALACRRPAERRVSSGSMP